MRSLTLFALYFYNGFLFIGKNGCTALFAHIIPFPITVSKSPVSFNVVIAFSYLVARSVICYKRKISEINVLKLTFHSCKCKCCLDAVNSLMFLSWYCLIKMAKENLPTRQFNRTLLIPVSAPLLCVSYLLNSNINIQILIESDEWFSPFSLSEPLVEWRAFEQRAKRDIQKMNAWASAIQRKNLSGERIANLEKMSECPALVVHNHSFTTWGCKLILLIVCSMR
jgi:hypothetical protein